MDPPADINMSAQINKQIPILMFMRRDIGTKGSDDAQDDEVSRGLHNGVEISPRRDAPRTQGENVWRQHCESLRHGCVGIIISCFRFPKVLVFPISKKNNLIPKNLIQLSDY